MNRKKNSRVAMNVAAQQCCHARPISRFQLPKWQPGVALALLGSKIGIWNARLRNNTIDSMRPMGPIGQFILMRHSVTVSAHPALPVGMT